MKIILIILLLCCNNGFTKEPENDELKMALIGIQTEDQEQVKTSLTYILQHQANIPSTHLIFASAQAFSLDQLEEAAYLLYAGQLRAKFDLQRFPPTQIGGESPKITLTTMMRQVGSLVNPEIYKKPEMYTRVVSNLAKFQLTTAQGYDPGWDYQYQLQTDQQRVILLDIAKTDLKQLADFSILLNNEDYFNAFTMLQNFHSLQESTQKLQTYIVDKEKAEAKMLEIETSLNIVGMFYKGESK